MNTFIKFCRLISSLLFFASFFASFCLGWLRPPHQNKKERKKEEEKRNNDNNNDDSFFFVTNSTLCERRDRDKLLTGKTSERASNRSKVQ
jgi:hypothetical protein